MRKVIFLAVAVTAVCIGATPDVQVGTSTQTEISAPSPTQTALFKRMRLRKRSAPETTAPAAKPA